MKVVVTMTSWKGRINHVPFAFYRFLTTQTVKPDFIYLWLSIDEFPNKEDDLPEDLINICNAFRIEIKWIKSNEYCFKRWYTCLDHYSDIVISIDDDVYYDKTLIARSIDYASRYTKCVINVGSPIYKPLSFSNGIKRILKSIEADIPLYNMQLCGQCIFLPNTFPLEIVNESETCKLRRIYCKKCDECGITPLLVKHHIPIITHRWDNKIDKAMQVNAVSNDMRHIKDLQLYLSIRLFPGCMDAWKSLYPGYNTTHYDNIPVDKILESLR